MNQSQHKLQNNLDNLLQRLKEDSVQYRDLTVPDCYEDKKNAVRSLMNIRMPRPIVPEILDIQDEFLQEERIQKGIVYLPEIPTVKEQYNSIHPFADQISIWLGDITRLQVGAIVNAANSQMLGCFVPCHRCIDNAIHSAAGMQLREACHLYMCEKRKVNPEYEEPTGHAMATLGFNLPCDYVIHTVGPIVRIRLNDSLRQDLRNCYQSVMECCMEHEIRSVAFCCISTGEFHFPNDQAAQIAVDTVTEILSQHKEQFDRVIFNVFKDQDKVIYEELLQQ